MTVEELRKLLEDCAPGAVVQVYAGHCGCWGEVGKVESLDGESIVIQAIN